MEDLSRLKSNLANGKMRELDFPTYQVINALISQIMLLQKTLNIRVTTIESDNFKDSDYLTSSDESATLPNSRELLAGARVSFDDTVSNERTVTADAINQLTGDITAGPGSGSQVATIPNDTITYAKMQPISAASRLLGRGDSGAGDVQELNLGSGLAIVGTELSSTATSSNWDILTDGDLIEPELIFASGEVIMIEVP